MKIPTQRDNPDGLHQRYIVKKANGEPVDPEAVYFVLRLDWEGDDHRHVLACREAVKAYAASLKHQGHLPRLADDLLTVLKDCDAVGNARQRYVSLLDLARQAQARLKRERSAKVWHKENGPGTSLCDKCAVDEGITDVVEHVTCKRCLGMLRSGCIIWHSYAPNGTACGRLEEGECVTERADQVNCPDCLKSRDWRLLALKAAPMFPCIFKKDGEEIAYPGLSLRDWFAGQTLAGERQAELHMYDPDRLAASCYRVADAMLKEKLKLEG